MGDSILQLFEKEFKDLQKELDTLKKAELILDQFSSDKQKQIYSSLEIKLYDRMDGKLIDSELLNNILHQSILSLVKEEIKRLEILLDTKQKMYDKIMEIISEVSNG